MGGRRVAGGLRDIAGLPGLRLLLVARAGLAGGPRRVPDHHGRRSLGAGRPGEVAGGSGRGALGVRAG
ncbi:MAG TPA: hypothetical protein VFA45_02905, partial [Actinomycetes bacterium]|nr:hypothetical protein [Actinomycetes bacterium]